MLDVSIIILTKNAGSKLEELINSIIKQKFNGNIEIIAIDSGSLDSTLDILEKYNVKIIKILPSDFHHSKTRNLGAENAKGKFLVYITQDAVPLKETFLSDLITPFDDSNVGATFGRQIANLNAKKNEVFFYSYFYPNIKRILDKKDAEDSKEFYLNNIYISNVCSAIRKEVWQKIRFKDDVSMSEDKDFALNVLRAGYKIVYEPKAVVYHSHNYTLNSLFKRRFKDGMAFSNITLTGENKFVKNGINYFVEEFKFLIDNNEFLLLPYTVLYDLIYFLAFKMGNHKNDLPWIVKNHFLRDEIIESETQQQN